MPCIGSFALSHKKASERSQLRHVRASWAFPAQAPLRSKLAALAAIYKCMTASVTFTAWLGWSLAQPALLCSLLSEHLLRLEPSPRACGSIEVVLIAIEVVQHKIYCIAKSSTQRLDMHYFGTP